jgi:prepilin-type N-terminal cleavage/methylation domain-containing protein/prepilin-type processing-associated H-X9-DG protein
MRRTRRGFTLIELLVVIAIIALLVSILAPMMRNIQELLRQVICINNLHQINAAMDLYRRDYQYRVHPSVSQGFGFWERPLGTPLPSSDYYAYWGVAYAPYMGNVRQIYRCPSALQMDCDTGYTDWVNQKWCTYGFNSHMASSQYFQVQKPSTTIICHDAFEHWLEVTQAGGLTDALTAANQASNLTQWRWPYRICDKSYCYYRGRGHESEYYRHLNKCEVLWYDGHVGSINDSDGRDVPWTWYTGG